MLFVVILCSFQTSRRRAAARQAKTGRETTEGFTRFVYKSLQTAMPIYLRSCGRASDGILVFENETDGGQAKLAYKLAADQPRRERDETMRAAISRAAELLQLPPMDPRSSGT